MAKMSKEELIKFVTDYIGDDKSDANIQLLENVTDSIEDGPDVSEYEAKIVDLENKIDSIDAEWREKYVARFSDYTPDASQDQKTETDNGANSEEDDSEPPTFEEIAEEF